MSVYVSAYELAYMCTRACMQCEIVYVCDKCLVHAYVGVSASVYVSVHVCVDVRVCMCVFAYERIYIYI